MATLAEHSGFETLISVGAAFVVNPFGYRVPQIPGRAFTVALTLLKQADNFQPLVLVFGAARVLHDFIEEAVHHRRIADLLGEIRSLLFESGEILPRKSEHLEGILNTEFDAGSVPKIDR